MKKRHNIVLADELWKAIGELSVKLDRSPTWVINDLLRKALKGMGK